jgi:hypothetical protein
VLAPVFQRTTTPFSLTPPGTLVLDVIDAAGGMEWAYELLTQSMADYGSVATGTQIRQATLPVYVRSPIGNWME